jgi:hypothetical protein
LVISFLDLCLTISDEIISWACVFCLSFMLLGFSLVHLVNFVVNHMLIWLVIIHMLIWFVVNHVLICFFDIIWTSFGLAFFCVCPLVLIGILSKLYLHLVFESIVHAYLLYIHFIACLLS